MSKIKKILLGILLTLVGFAAATFTVCFFDLDSKLTAAVEPILRKRYDRIDRDRNP